MSLIDKALTDLDTVNAELGFTTGVDPIRDALLERYINVASQAFQTLIDRCLAKTVYTGYKAASNNSNNFYLKEYPILSVESFQISGDDYDYEIIETGEEGSYLYNEDGFVGNARVFGSLTRTYYGESSLDVEVDYTAGYVLPKDAGDPTPIRTLPYDIEDAVINVVIIKYKERCMGATGMKSYKNGKRTIEFNDLFEGIYGDIIDRYGRPEQ